MANPKFVLGSHILQFSRGLQYPVSQPKEKIQATDRRASGHLEVEMLGININTFVLVFDDMPLNDYLALDNWFDNIANGAVNQFTFFDADGVASEVVIVTKKLDFQETGYKKYSGQLLLESV